MAIVINYDVPYPIAGEAAYEAGSAQGRKEQQRIAFEQRLQAQQQALREQSFAEQRRQFDSDQAFRANLANLEDQRSRRATEAAMLRSRQDLDLRLRELSDRRQGRAQDKEMEMVKYALGRRDKEQDRLANLFGYQFQSDLRIKENAAERALMEKENERRAQRAFELDSMDAVDERVKEELQRYDEIAGDLTDDAAQELSGFRSRIRSVQSQRHMLRDGQYEKAIGNIVSELNKSGIENRRKKQPTAQEIFDQRTVPIPGTKSVAILKRDAHGNEYIHIEHIEPEKQQSTIPIPEEKWDAAQKAARERMEKEWESTQPVDSIETVPYFSDEEVARRSIEDARKRREIYDSGGVPDKPQDQDDAPPTTIHDEGWLRPSRESTTNRPVIDPYTGEQMIDPETGNPLTETVEIPALKPSIDQETGEIIPPVLGSRDQIRRAISSGWEGWFMGPDGYYRKIKDGRVYKYYPPQR